MCSVHNKNWNAGKPDATTSSTLISLAAARQPFVSCTSSSVVFTGRKQPADQKKIPPEQGIVRFQNWSLG